MHSSSLDQQTLHQLIEHFDLAAHIEFVRKEYEKRFGFIFIIRAAGRTADEVLASLEERLGNDADSEFAIAAREQQQITNLRLMKLLQGDA